MKLLAALKSFAGTAVNVAAKNPMRTLAVVVIAIVVIAAIFGKKKEGMRNGGLTVRAVPSKYPFWGRRGTKNEGLRCKNDDNTGCTTSWKNGALMDLEPASTANLLPWPTSQIPGGPGQLLLTAYKNNILRIHSKNKSLKTIADVEKIWGLYRNPHNGLYEILVMSADVPAKQAASAETWRRTKLMIDLVAKTTNLPQKFVKKLQEFASIPNRYGGLSPISECDETIGAGAGAMASNPTFKGGNISHVLTLWRVPPRDVEPGETMADKRFGIIIHEMSHAACHAGCAGLDGGGHCGEQKVVEDALRKVCAKRGLKRQLPAKTLKFFAEKCAKFAASRK